MTSAREVLAGLGCFLAASDEYVGWQVCRPLAEDEINSILAALRKAGHMLPHGCVAVCRVCHLEAVGNDCDGLYTLGGHFNCPLRESKP